METICRSSIFLTTFAHSFSLCFLLMWWILFLCIIGRAGSFWIRFFWNHTTFQRADFGHFPNLMAQRMVALSSGFEWQNWYAGHCCCDSFSIQSCFNGLLLLETISGKWKNNALAFNLSDCCLPGWCGSEQLFSLFRYCNSFERTVHANCRIYLSWRFSPCQN